MLSNNLRGHLSLLLVLAIAVSLFPVSAQASEEAVPAETAMEVIPETTVPTEDILQEEPSALPMLQQKMDDILVKYLGVTVLTEEEIIDIVNTMYWDDMEAALAECDALEPMISALSEDELTQIEATYEGTATIVCFYETMQLAMTPGFFAVSGTHTPITGVTVTVSGATDNSMANGAVTVTAKGSDGLWGLGASAKTATITVKNSTADKATISFNWTATSVNQLKIDGTVVGGTSGSFAKLLDSEGEFTITVTTAKNSTTNKLEMSNFDWQKAADSSNITFVYDSTLGSITVDGTETSSGTTKKISVDGTALTAKAGSGVTFLGWIDDADGRILATAADSTLQPASDMTIRAVFAKTSPWFQVDSTYLIEGLTEATAKGSMIVLMNNATLPSGNYTIDSGKTLLIPYNSTLSCVKADPVTADTTFVIPTAYRTLTMADGAHITIKGEMSLSGVLNSVQGTNSSTHGPTSFVKMSSGSSITVKEKASLYVWGYITGVTDSSGNFSEGTVTVERDGTVYEPFQAADWRGGTASLAMVDNEQRVFPISQYYVQNVEVPMTLNAGAIEQGSLIVDISLAGVVKPQVPFIGKGSNMFCIEKGSITKDYAENSDRLIVDINGDLSVSNITVDLVNVLSYQIALESKKYVLPVTCNMSININSGSTVTIKQDLSLLPGSVLNIKNNGKLIVNSGSNVFAYDRDDWIGNKYVFSLADFRILKHAPGRKKTRTDDDLVDASVIIEGEVSVNAGFGYTSANGAAISGIEGGKITVALGTQTSTYQATQNNTSVSYQSITVTPLQLLNANGEYVGTAEKGAGTYTYLNGFWHKAPCDGTTTENTTATCTEAGEKTVKCGCGVINTKENDPALGHSYGDWTPKTPATLDSAAVEERICGRCSDVDTRTLNSASIDSQEYETLADALSEAGAGATVTLLTDITGKTTVSQQVTIQIGSFSADIQAGEGFTYAKNGTVITIGKAVLGIGAVNLRAGDSLDLFFYVKKTALANSGYTDFYAKIERTKGGTVQPAETISYAQWEDYNETYVRFCYDGIAAKEMTDSVTVTVYSADGKPLSSAYTDSVQGYAMRMIRKGSSSAALKTALVDMLNYGAAAQTHFGFNTSSLANALIESEGYSSLATKETPVCTKITGNPDAFYAGSVSVKNNLTFTFCFSGIDPYKIATATYTDHYGKNKTPSGTFYTLTDENGVTVTNGGQTVYGVDIEDIAIADGRQKITCTVTDVSGNEIQAISSVKSYLAYAMEKYPDEDVFPMLAKFIDSAYAYFHQ